MTCDNDPILIHHESNSSAKSLRLGSMVRSMGRNINRVFIGAKTHHLPTIDPNFPDTSKYTGPMDPSWDFVNQRCVLFRNET